MSAEGTRARPKVADAGDFAQQRFVLPSDVWVDQRKDRHEACGRHATGKRRSEAAHAADAGRVEA